MALLLSKRNYSFGRQWKVVNSKYGTMETSPELLRLGYLGHSWENASFIFSDMDVCVWVNGCYFSDSDSFELFWPWLRSERCGSRQYSLHESAVGIFDLDWGYQRRECSCCVKSQYKVSEYSSWKTIRNSEVRNFAQIHIWFRWCSHVNNNCVIRNLFVEIFNVPRYQGY